MFTSPLVTTVLNQLEKHNLIKRWKKEEEGFTLVDNCGQDLYVMHEHIDRFLYGYIVGVEALRARDGLKNPNLCELLPKLGK